MRFLPVIGRLFRGSATLLIIVVLTGPRTADASDFRRGDVFLNTNSPGRILHYRSDGAFVQIFEGTGFTWEGAAVTPDRRIVTTRRLPVAGVNIFDAHGNEVTFDTPQLTIPADVSVFSDGTLAVSNQEDSIELYTLSGQHLSSIHHEALVFGTVFGSAVGPDDTLWVASLSPTVSRFSKSGEYLGSLTFPFPVADIAIDPLDGTLWIPDRMAVLHNYDVEGNELISFQTAATPPFAWAIAVGPDGSLYVSSHDSTSIFHYDRDGTLLDTIPYSVGRAVFMAAFLVPEPSSICSCLASLVCFLMLTRRSRLLR